MSETPNPFQPRSAQELIADAFHLYRDHLTILVQVSLLPQVLILLVQIPMIFFEVRGMGGLLTIVVLMVILKAINISVILTVVTGVLIGHPPNLRQAYSYTLTNRLFTVIITFVITFLISSLGFMFFVLPGILMGGLLILALPVAALEGLTPFLAINRSITMLRGFAARGVAIFCFALLVSELVPLMFHMLVGLGQFTPLLAAVLTAVTMPLAYTAMVLFYVSMRALDGYNPEQLEKDLTWRLHQ